MPKHTKPQARAPNAQGQSQIARIAVRKLEAQSRGDEQRSVRSDNDDATSEAPLNKKKLLLFHPKPDRCVMGFVCETVECPVDLAPLPGDRILFARIGCEDSQRVACLESQIKNISSCTAQTPIGTVLWGSLSRHKIWLTDSHSVKTHCYFLNRPEILSNGVDVDMPINFTDEYCPPNKPTPSTHLLPFLQEQPFCQGLGFRIAENGKVWLIDSNKDACESPTLRFVVPLLLHVRYFHDQKKMIKRAEELIRRPQDLHHGHITSQSATYTTGDTPKKGDAGSSCATPWLK